jgi:hypothetical protein
LSSVPVPVHRAVALTPVPAAAKALKQKIVKGNTTDGVAFSIRSGFKTPSKAQWLLCRPPINAHIPMYAALSRSAYALPLNLI